MGFSLRKWALEDDANTGEGKSLTARAFWLMVAKTLGYAFSFALPLLLVRRLSQTDLGLYKQVFLVIGTAIVILPVGFATSAFYFLPREREGHAQIVLNVMLFNLTVGGAACLALWLYPALLKTVFNSAEIVEFAPLIGLVILLWLVSSFLEIVVVARQELKLSTIFIVMVQFTRTSLLLGAAVWFGTVRSLVYAALIQGVLQTVVLLVYLHARFAGFWRGFDWSVMRMQMAYALPLGCAGLLYSVQVDLHNYFVSNRFGAAAFAVYSIGCFNLPLLGILSDSIASVMIPRVSYLQSREEHREIILLTARVVRKLAFIYFPPYAFLIITGREFIVLLFTAAYSDSWPIFAVNLTLLPFYILAVDPIQRAYTEHRYFLLKLRSALLVVLFIALWFGTKHFGLVGTIVTVVGISIFERLAITANIGKLVGLTRGDFALFKDVPKVAVASLVAGVATALARACVPGARPFVVLAVCGVVFSAVFTAAVLFLRVLSPDERETIVYYLTRLRDRAWWRRAAPTP